MPEAGQFVCQVETGAVTWIFHEGTYARTNLGGAPVGFYGNLNMMQIAYGVCTKF